MYYEYMCYYCLTTVAPSPVALADSHLSPPLRVVVGARHGEASWRGVMERQEAGPLGLDCLGREHRRDRWGGGGRDRVVAVAALAQASAEAIGAAAEPELALQGGGPPDVPPATAGGCRRREPSGDAALARRLLLLLHLLLLLLLLFLLLLDGSRPCVV